MSRPKFVFKYAKIFAILAQFNFKPMHSGAISGKMYTKILLKNAPNPNFFKSPLSNQALLGPSQHQCVIRVHIGMGRNQPVQFKSLKKNPMLPNTLAKYPEYLGPQISEVQKSPGSGSIDSSRYVSGDVITLKIMFNQFPLELLFLL